MFSYIEMALRVKPSNDVRKVNALTFYKENKIDSPVDLQGGFGLPNLDLVESLFFCQRVFPLSERKRSEQHWCRAIAYNLCSYLGIEVNMSNSEIPEFDFTEYREEMFSRQVSALDALM